MQDRLNDHGLTFSKLSAGNYHLANWGPFGHMRGLGAEKPPVRVIIQEQDHSAVMRDTAVTYSSNALPTWFRPLRYLLEDDGFTQMTVQLGEVTYCLMREKVTGEHATAAATERA